MSQFSTEKYIFKPYPYSSHSMIISWLEKLPKGTKILDIGTATGCIGKIVQNKGFELYGLEPEVQWSEVARPFYRDILCSELEHAESSYLNGYQVVLLADVLEYIPHAGKGIVTPDHLASEWLDIYYFRPEYCEFMGATKPVIW